MTTHALLPKLLPGLYFLGLILLAIILGFNGLYGQDAHEYLRQSQALFDRLHGSPMPALGIGDLEFAGGYPLAGALLRHLLGDAVWALQGVSFIAAAFSLRIFERLLALLAPGARAESRWVYLGLALALSPMFLRSGLCSMSDALGLMLVMASFYYGLRAFESRRGPDVVLAALFAGFAMTTRYAFVPLLVPLALILFYLLVLQQKWRSLLLGIGAASISLLPHFWLKGAAAVNPLGHTSLAGWSLLHFFQHRFADSNGGISDYSLPNILYVLFPAGHPAFGLALPGLYFLFKKTDLALPAKKILLVCVGCYLFFLAGFPHQNLRHLLPAYIICLLLLFPAWDRLYCYGFLFFRKLTLGLLIGAFMLQLCFCVHYLQPILARNQLEKTIARQLKTQVPPKATLYAFDLDVALRSYLPDLQHYNLWEKRYVEFPPGSYLLFNEALRPQWQGQNPVLNWDDAQTNQTLQLQGEYPQGWQLWEVIE